MEYFSYKLANEEEKQTKENKNKQKQTNKNKQKKKKRSWSNKTEQDIDHNQNHNKHDDVRPDDHGGCVLYHLSDDTFLRLKPSFEIAEIEKNRMEYGETGCKLKVTSVQ